MTIVEPPPGPGAEPDTGVLPTVVAEEPVGPLDRWSDPTALLIASGVLLVAALLPWAAKSIVTLPLALVLPAHCLLAALDRPDRDLSGGVRVALRVVLSLALIALVVLAVGAVFGVQRFSVLAGVWLLCTVCSFLGWNHDVPQAPRRDGHRWTQSGVLLAVTVVVATVVVAGALLVLPQPRQEPFSSLAVAGTSRSSGFPIRVRSGTTAEVQIEVVNGSEERGTYRVIGAIDGGAAWDAPAVRLDPGEREVVTIEGKIPEDACLSRLRVSLSRDREDSGVRPLILYVRNEGGDACG